MDQKVNNDYGNENWHRVPEIRGMKTGTGVPEIRSETSILSVLLFCRMTHLSNDFGAGRTWEMNLLTSGGTV